MKWYLFLTVALFIHFSCSQPAGNSTIATPQQTAGIAAKVLTENLEHPWEMVWGPDNYIWMTERGGRISRVNPATGAVQPIYTVPDVQSTGEGGLLGMALHPDFSTYPFVYIVYNYSRSGSYKEKVVRFTYNGSTLTKAKILMDNIDAAGIHNGSRLLITDEKLFITTGDAAHQSAAQDASSVNGKILRLNLDGSIPADNPFGDHPVWSWGHRNAQGLVMVGNKLFISEHGPNSDDEINIIEKGGNYGWPNVKGLCNTAEEQSFCTANNVKEPIYTWTPTAAVCGLAFYNSNLIPQWKNSLLLVALKNSRLYQLKLNAAQNSIEKVTEYFNETYGRLRDVCVAPDGKVYICTSNGRNDKIIAIN